MAETNMRRHYIRILAFGIFIVFTKLIDLFKLIGCIYVHHRKRDLSKKSLPRNPEHRCGVLTYRPKKGDIFKLAVRLTHDIDGSRLQL